MTDMVTLIAQTSPLERELRTASRTVEESDLPRLGELYFTAYEPGIAGESLQAAREDIKSSMAGKYGQFLPKASHVALDENGTVVAAVLVVERAIGDDTPEAPFIIELFTDREHRRRGLAEDLVLATMDALFNVGQKHVALRVKASNSAALALYLSLDFRRWSPEENED
ncbi:GNAT family N-acetyltransferase [Arthrobacter cryoconiti]|uniref:GNAT family N-acetyltransferase n=1 Tax=Arthrobacter cryoconiti TaxID=748907 RepID=A0ABV8R347_9MICC|nr:GNAT family N-acetyltransferase [Arthrobacter cryoconiti]MCC9068466.1 GNAT family N-acetyltransferase [Arthrobacter cryoconiti]